MLPKNSKIHCIKAETLEKDKSKVLHFMGYSLTSFRFGGDLNTIYEKDTFPLSLSFRRHEFFFAQTVLVNKDTICPTNISPVTKLALCTNLNLNTIGRSI